MSDPDRLLESTDDEVERLLLRAGRESAPRAAQERALLVATALVTAPSVSAGGGATAGKAAGGTKTASIVSLKWVTVIGLASVGAFSGTMAVRAAHESSPVLTAKAANSKNDATKLLAATTQPPPVGTASGSPSPDPRASLARTPDRLGRSLTAATVGPTARPAPSMRSRAEAITPSGSTAAEVTFLDGARRAIGDGDPPTALSILDDYMRHFPHGILAPEASVLRIEALVAAGDRSAALLAAQSFLQANPTSPYAQRIESLVGIPNP
jgi:hypothetical protein